MGIAAAASTIYCKANNIETNNFSRFLNGILLGVLTVYSFDFLTSTIGWSFLKLLRFIDDKLP
jgi:hypothetical protein